MLVECRNRAVVCEGTRGAYNRSVLELKRGDVAHCATALTGYIRNVAITKVDRKASCHPHGSVETQPSQGATQPSCDNNYQNWRSWSSKLNFEPMSHQVMTNTGN